MPQPAPDQTPPPPPAPRKRLPWSVTLLLTAAGFIPALVLVKLGHSHLAPAVVAGIVMGLFGAMIGTALTTALGGAILLGVLGLHSLYPALDPRLAGVLFALAAGWETARMGGRAMPLALACAVLIWVLPKAGLSEPQIAGLFAAGLAGGLGLACLTGLAGIAKVPAEGDRAGLQQAIFLALGVALSITLARQLPSAHALWVVDIFVIRAITPSHLAISKAWRYAIGTLIGVALVLGLEHSGLLTAQSMHITAALTLVIGLRLLPVGPPWPTAFFTIAVLFSLAPTPDDALFRSEAALLAAGLAILLRVLLNQLLRVPENRAQAIDP